MKSVRAIIFGVIVYLGLHFGEKGVHFIYFYLTHDFSTSNILMIKSSLMLTLATLLGGAVAGYISGKGLPTGFIVGIISGFTILLLQQLSGANLFLQEFTPAILFDEVFLKACICSAGGAAGQLLRMR